MFGDEQRGAVDGGEGAGVRVAGRVSGGGGGGWGLEIIAKGGLGWKVDIDLGSALAVISIWRWDLTRKDMM